MELNSQADPTEVQLLQALPLGLSARVRGSGSGFEPRTGPEGNFAALSWQQQTHTLAHGKCMHTFRSEGVALFSPTLSATCAPSEPYAPPWLGTSSAPPSSAPPYPLRPPPHSSHLQPLQLCGTSVPVATSYPPIRPPDLRHISQPPGKAILPHLPHPRPHRHRRCLRRPHALLDARAASSR